MLRTQRLIVASLVLVIGLGLGFFLSGFYNFQKLEPVENLDTEMTVALTPSEHEFKVALDTVMQVERKEAVGGYTPEMLLSAFPRLIPEDFAGAAAVVGRYEYVNGELTYTNTEVVDGAADNLTDEGISTLRRNVYRRLMLSDTQDTPYVMQLLKTVGTATITPPIIPPATSAGTICPQDTKLCPDGSSVGRTGLDCGFAACGGTAPQPKEVTCTDEQRDALCTQQYEPVCASYQVQCIKAPCNPVPKEYGNGCSACSDKNVISYTQGQCAVPTS